MAKLVSKESRSLKVYTKVKRLGLIYGLLSGYEKNFIKRVLSYGDPENMFEELSYKQLRYINTLSIEYKDFIRKAHG